MFHLLAYDSSIAAGAVLVDCKSIVDQSGTQSGDGYVIADPLNKIIAAYGFGVNLTRVQIQSPTLQLLGNQEIQPVDVAAPAAGTNPGMVNFFATPRQLKATETLIVQVIQTNAGAQQVIVGIWLADAAPQPVKGEILTVRWTSATTLVANAWTVVIPTLSQNLLPGKYQIVGSRMKGATAVLHRWVVQGYAPRPGGASITIDNAQDEPGQRYGGWGVWAEFQSNLLPNCEVLATAADTAQTGWLDLMKSG